MVKEIEEEGGVKALIGKGEVYLSDAEKRQEVCEEKEKEKRNELKQKKKTYLFTKK